MTGTASLVEAVATSRAPGQAPLAPDPDQEAEP
jgi:hypothetical protein